MGQLAMACSALMLGHALTGSAAQGYTVKPVRLIVPCPPGGPTAFVGRAGRRVRVPQ